MLRHKWAGPVIIANLDGLQGITQIFSDFIAKLCPEANLGSKQIMGRATSVALSLTTPLPEEIVAVTVQAQIWEVKEGVQLCHVSSPSSLPVAATLSQTGFYTLYFIWYMRVGSKKKK